ncbi:hypothetical protein NLM59_10390 [Weeksellaceae bacterium KMM 9724]|uniref:hypothetical protein n=1 Tax=Profundicola chukchiensis TaxID=2961959 RepID=UPI00243AF5C7|nr:hypothetical protein [Profundicola chukchiensis]MDG4951336.1 hypothetical protein [Profundicola chukchiensis]
MEVFAIIIVILVIIFIFYFYKRVSAKSNSLNKDVLVNTELSTKPSGKEVNGLVHNHDNSCSSGIYDQLLVYFSDSNESFYEDEKYLDSLKLGLEDEETKQQIGRAQLFKLIGEYYVVNNRVSEAIKSWEKAIEEDPKIGLKLKLKKLQDVSEISEELKQQLLSKRKVKRKKKKRDFNWVVKNYISFFNRFNIDEEALKSKYLLWNKNNSQPIEDFVWYMFNSMLDENAKKNQPLNEFYQKNAEIYSEMTSFRRVHEGKTENELYKLYNENSVKANVYNSKVELEVAIIGAPDCIQGRKLNKKMISVEEALENTIIPYDECSRGACMCMYSVVSKHDSDGSLIFKE